MGISDFRHMTKDKVVEFASLLPQLDPEVAKKALEQFPTFTSFANEIVATYKTLICELIKSNEEDDQAFYNACNTIIESLQQVLAKEDISSEERERTEDKMIEVAKMIGEKGEQNKKFRSRVIGILGGLIGVITLAAAALLGTNARISKEDKDEDDIDNETDSDEIIDID